MLLKVRWRVLLVKLEMCVTNSSLSMIMATTKVQDLSDEECFDKEGDGAESRPIQTPSEAKRKLGAPSPLTPKLCSYLTTPDLKGSLKR